MKKLALALGLVIGLTFLSGCSMVLAEPETLITAPATDTAQLKERDRKSVV